MAAHLRDAFFLVLCLVNVAGAVALLLLPDWSAAWLPWELDRFSRLFLGAILAATAAGILTIVISGEYAAAAAGSLDLIVAYCGVAAYVFLIRPEPAAGALLVFGWLCVISAFTVIAIFAWSSRLDFKSRSPMSAALRLIFAGFGLVFLVGGVGLSLGWPNVLPWAVAPDLSPILGAVTLGAAAYVLHPVVVPVLANAKGQLVSLIVFAAVMLPALTPLFGAIEPARQTSLIVVCAVLIVGLAAAIVTLFLRPRGTTDAAVA